MRYQYVQITTIKNAYSFALAATRHRGLTDTCLIILGSWGWHMSRLAHLNIQYAYSNLCCKNSIRSHIGISDIQREYLMEYFPQKKVLTCLRKTWITMWNGSWNNNKLSWYGLKVCQMFSSRIWADTLLEFIPLRICTRTSRKSIDNSPSEMSMSMASYV